jgi:ribosomal protein S2
MTMENIPDPHSATSQKTIFFKYILLSRHQSAGQNHDINIANRGFENVAQVRYLGMTITNQNPIQEKITRLNSGNACYHSV